ncbi:hypothetical protein F5884DRAFT_780534 [Xylogone sp. PMI_703]|nr:hypothetical protein F5884DRAFT_780534 [Xylogone sp. PMI_703]
MVADGEGGIRLRTEIHDLELKLNEVVTILAVAKDPGSRILVDRLVDIHHNIKNTLHMINSAYETNRERTYKGSQASGSLEQRLATDNLKLRVLLNTLNFKKAVQLNLHESLSKVYNDKRCEHIQKYIEAELQLHRRGSKEKTKIPFQKMWETLHEDYHLYNIVENSLKLQWSFTQRLHAYAEHLNAASNPRCSTSTRWLHCMMCIRHIQLVKASLDYQTAFETSTSDLAELGFTITNYITQLEIELVSVLVDQQVTIADPNSVVEYINSGFTSFSGRDSIQEPDSQFLSDEGNDGEIIRVSINSLHRGILLQRNRNRSITIEPIDESDFPKLKNLSDVDLRSCILKPRYAAEQSGSVHWDLTINYNPSLGSITPTLPLQSTLSFRNPYDAFKFQENVTNYHVFNDHGPGVRVRTYRGWSQSKSYFILGRLQFWERLQAPTTTVLSSRLASQSISHGNESNVAIVIEDPNPPLIVLLVESSGDPGVKEGDLFAITVEPKIKVNKKKCECLENPECTRCILYRTRRAFLTLQHGKVPKFGDAQSWVEIKFQNSNDRKRFEQELELLRWRYIKMLNQSVRVQSLLRRRNLFLLS